MRTPLNDVEAQAMQLPAPERADLADRLWASVSAPEDTEAAWDAEIRHRLSQVDAGEVVCVPWASVMDSLRVKYG